MKGDGFDTVGGIGVFLVVLLTAAVVNLSGFSRPSVLASSGSQIKSVAIC
jgi:hypothetical protein